MTDRTTTAGAVEQLELARRIVKQSLTPENHKRCHCRDEIDEGKWDNGMNVRVALAAIIETRAQIINSLRHDFDEWPDYVALADVADALEGKDET